MTTYLRGLAIALIAMTLPHDGAMAENRVVGEVVALRGSATGQPSADAASTGLAVGETLTEGETLKTSADSRLKIALRDGSTLTLGADATLKLDHLSLGADATSLTLTGGFLRALVAPVRADARFEVHTPSMVAAVRGTEWIENFNSSETQIFVAHGRVVASGVASGPADNVALTAGDGVTFSDKMMTRGLGTGSSLVGMSAHTPVLRWNAAKIRAFEDATSFR
jgi:hypothetical protein